VRRIKVAHSVFVGHILGPSRGNQPFVREILSSELGVSGTTLTSPGKAAGRTRVQAHIRGKKKTRWLLRAPEADSRGNADNK
jgi:hypothetical protein